MSMINKQIDELRAYAKGRKGELAKLINDAAFTIELLSAKQPELQWIPCSERLPEDGTWNIFSDGKNISVERYKMDAIDHFFPQGRWFSFDKAIAWMPLPEPYAEKKTDETDKEDAIEPEIVRCKDCKWFHDIGCAIQIVDDSDKPSENDYCSFAERRTYDLQ